MDWQGAYMARAVAAFPRTYWVNAPQGTIKPYATLFDVTESRPQTLTDWDLVFARIQLDAWGETYQQVQALMEVLLEALVPANTGNGYTFQRADIALGPRDIGGEREGDTIIYRKSVDLITAYNPGSGGFS